MSRFITIANTTVNVQAAVIDNAKEMAKFQAEIIDAAKRRSQMDAPIKVKYPKCGVNEFAGTVSTQLLESLQQIPVGQDFDGDAMFGIKEEKAAAFESMNSVAIEVNTYLRDYDYNSEDEVDISDDRRWTILADIIQDYASPEDYADAIGYASLVEEAESVDTALWYLAWEAACYLHTRFWKGENIDALDETGVVQGAIMYCLNTFTWEEVMDRLNELLEKKPEPEVTGPQPITDHTYSERVREIAADQADYGWMAHSEVREIVDDTTGEVVASYWSCEDLDGEEYWDYMAIYHRFFPAEEKKVIIEPSDAGVGSPTPVNDEDIPF